MELFIRSLLGNAWRLHNLSDSTTVEILKLLIYRKTGMYPYDQRLMRGTHELVDDLATLGALGVRDRETLHLHPHIRSGF